MMTEGSELGRRAAALIQQGTFPRPPGDAPADVQDLIVPFCMEEIDRNDRVRVMSAIYRSPHLLDEITTTRAALRAAGALPEHIDSPPDDELFTSPSGIRRPRVQQTFPRAKPPAPPASAVFRPRSKRRRRWFSAALALAATISTALIATHSSDRPDAVASPPEPAAPVGDERLPASTDENPEVGDPPVRLTGEP